MLQKMNEDKDRSDQKVQELEGSLGLAMQSIRHGCQDPNDEYKPAKGRFEDSPDSVNGG